MRDTIDQTPDGSEAEKEALREQLAGLKEQRAQLERELQDRNERETAGAAVLAQFSPADQLMIKGAGVDPEDIIWRVKAGCLVYQAIQVALATVAEEKRVAASAVKR